MRRPALAVLAFGSIASAWAATPWWRGSLTFTNGSRHDVHHLFLTRAHQHAWGKDWLRSGPLRAGESVMVLDLDLDLECAEYDFKLLDDQEGTCIVESRDLCQQGAHWVISNQDLAHCPGWGKARTSAPTALRVPRAQHP